MVWAIGFLAITLARWRGWLRARASLRAGSPVGLPIPIPALITPGAGGPGTIGFFRPALVLPAQLLERLNPQQLAAILAHEMCHVRRRDNIFAAAHMVVEAIFWFHPLVWWIGSRLLEERELACDEEVIRMGCEPSDYVQGILKICRFFTESSSPCISGVTGADVKKRLRAILSGSVAQELAGGKRLALVIAGLATLAAPILIGMLNAPPIGAQNAPATTPKFEVSSVKPTGVRGEGGSMRPYPGRFTAAAPLRVLIEAAYHVQPFQIVGGPEWIRSDQYEIDAKAAGNPAHAQLLLVLQSLLADRFQLQFHRESREMPIYKLAAARDGMKLPSPQDGSCADEQPLSPKPRCGGMNVPLESGAWHMRGGKVPMAEFVRVLSMMLGRKVIDQTGYSGVFDVDLQFRADDTTLAGFPPSPLPVETDSPPIFSAVQQLGLRLESTKGPVEVLVIDHVDKPSAN